MRRRPKLALAILAAAFSAGCVSLEEEVLPKASVARDQRTLLLVFASPAPVMAEDDSKAETAAKIVPGLGIVVKAAQDDAAAKKSKELQQYLPAWDPAAELLPIVAKELKNSGHPGRFIELSEAPDLAPDRLKVMNRADDVNDWQLRYYILNPNYPAPRNYSALLSLDDALIFEVNLRWGLALGDEDKATPTLGAVTRLVRASTSHVIWRHEDTAVDAAGARTSYEFKTQPDDLLAKYRRLFGPLAQALVATYRRNLMGAGLFQNPTISIAPAYGVSLSTGVALSTAAPAAMPLPPQPHP